MREQQRRFIVVGNSLQYFFTDSEQTKAATEYKRCAAIVSLLSPMDVEGGSYLRIGRDYDGGYVMFDNFKEEIIDAAYSFGIDNDISWDEEIAKRNIDVFMYDHTIYRFPQQHAKLHFFKIGLTGQKQGRRLKTLKEILAQNKHAQSRNLIMKMDIEGCEWDVLQNTKEDVINQFSQMVMV